MRTMLKRQFSPAEMEEIRKDLFRARGNAAVVAQLHACKVDELRAALGDEADKYQWPHGRKKGRPYRYWSPEDRDLVKQMMDDGHSIGECAEYFGVSYVAMYTVIRRWWR